MELRGFVRFRIEKILRNGVDGIAPRGFEVGVEYNQEEINKALQAGTNEERKQIVKSQDFSGHGTAVAGVAAGSGSKGFGQYRGVAPESELIVVKLGTPDRESFPRTTELMMGLDYVMRKALEYRRPVAINLSFGYPSVTALILWTRKYQKCPLNINLQFFHSILLYL